jgi:hypothetical protein
MVENDRRWWAVPGENAATLDYGTATLQVRLNFDDGVLWGLAVGSETVVWDHGNDGFAMAPKGLTHSAAQKLRDALRAMGAPRPGWQLTSGEQAVLDWAALDLKTSLQVSGRKLRQALGVTKEDFLRVSRFLTPRYLDMANGPNGDSYRLTFPGILRSNARVAASATIEAALAVLRTKFEADPDVRTFTTDEVIARGGFEPTAARFIDGVVQAAWLLDGASGGGSAETWRMTFGVPSDIEDIVRCSTMASFIQHVRNGRHSCRVWPTAPVRLTGVRITGPSIADAFQPAPSHVAATTIDVALSFAGEDRSHAEALAERLLALGVTVFYDLHEQATLWGRDLYQHLHTVYSQQATYCVIFVSSHYAKKLWTNHELRAAQERAFKERGSEYILPIRLDDTALPGLSTTVGYVNINEGIERLAHLVVAKLRTRHGA